MTRDASRIASVSCVRKKSLYSGDSSDMGCTRDKVGGQHIVHVLNERAELAPDQGYTIHVSRTLSGAFCTTIRNSRRRRQRIYNNGIVPCPTGSDRPWPHAGTPWHWRAYARAAGRYLIRVVLRSISRNCRLR
jgi:hypothetical protein